MNNQSKHHYSMTAQDYLANQVKSAGTPVFITFIVL